MTVILAAGQLKQLNAALTPVFVEPAIEVISAFWDKGIYEPGEFAALTVTVKNLASASFTYDSIARCIQNNEYVVRFENTFSLAAGEERDIIFSGNVPSDPRTYFVYLDSYYEGELFHQRRMPDLVVSAPAIGVQFIMLGGIFNSRTWHLDEDVYVKSGTLMNVGDEVGTTTVVGWFRVGNYGTIYDIYEETITLGPGESRELSYSITRAEMEAAQAEAGYPSHGLYEPLQVFISTADHIGFASSIYGNLSTEDTVYF